MLGQTWRVTPLIALSLLAAAVLAPAAGAATTATNGDATISIATDTAVVGPDTRAIRATVTLTTRAKPTKLVLQTDSPRFVRYLNGRRFAEGNTLRYLGIERTTGPLTFPGGGGGGGDGLGCSELDWDPRHGESVDYGLVFVQLPAASTATLTFLYEPVGDAPWLNTDYAPKVILIPTKNRGFMRDMYTVPKRWSWFRRGAVLQNAAPVVTGPLGARVDFAISPRPKRPGEMPWGSVRVGTKLTLSGRIVPARGGYPINIVLDPTLSGSEHTIATATTDAAGAFSASWTPRRLGGYSLRAEYPGSPGADLLPDSGCGIPFDVEPKRRKRR